MCQRQVLRIPGGQAGGFQGLQQQPLSQRGLELPLWARAQRQRLGTARGEAQALEFGLKAGGDTSAVDQLARANAGYPFGHLVNGAFGQVDHALRHGQPGQPAGVARALVHRQQQRFGFVALQFAVGQRARGNDAHHFSLYRAFASDLAHLFAHRHRLAQRNKPRQVALNRVKWHARHHHWLPGRLAPARQRNVQQARGFFGVGIKQLVKIPHAVQQQCVGVPGFQAQVLLHHRGVLFGFGAHRCNTFWKNSQRLSKKAP